jgi:hypothetical protein
MSRLLLSFLLEPGMGFGVKFSTMSPFTGPRP